MNRYTIHVSTMNGRNVVPVEVRKIERVDGSIIVAGTRRILTDYSPSETELLVRCARKWIQ